MKLSSLIPRNHILFRDSVNSFKDALNLLIDEMAQNNSALLSKEKIVSSVLERESLGNNICENGIAIPHARISGLNDVIVAVFILKKPINYENKNVKIIFLLLTSKHSSQLYLNTLAAIARFSSMENICEDIDSFESVSQFIHYLDNQDIFIKKELCTEDIMTIGGITALKNYSVKDVLDLFAKNKIHYAPVVDETNTIIGEVTLYDIIKIGIPNYATMIGNLSFLKSFEPLEELLKQEEVISVEKIMKTPLFCAHPSMSIIELAFKMTTNNIWHVSVTKEGKLVGVVSVADLMNKILRG